MVMDDWRKLLSHLEALGLHRTIGQTEAMNAIQEAYCAGEKIGFARGECHGIGLANEAAYRDGLEAAARELEQRAHEEKLMSYGDEPGIVTDRDQFIRYGAWLHARDLIRALVQKGQECAKCHGSGFVSGPAGQMHCECNPVLPHSGQKVSGLNCEDCGHQRYECICGFFHGRGEFNDK
jgi:hypothetical protein